MTEPLQRTVNELRSYLPDLERRRSSDTLANDLYEAAHYWCNLGSWVLENNTKVNYPERVRGEVELLAKLRNILQGKPSEEQEKYGPLLKTAEEILLIVGAVQPPKGGHLGFLSVAIKHFHFLQIDYGFSVTGQQPTSIRFSSGAVYVELEHSINPWLSCRFGPESAGREHFFSISDLLFLNHDDRYRTLPEKLTVSTEGEVESWLKFLADAFRQYGHDVLNNEPGALERLAKAQAERDEEYRLGMERLHR
jgi:hypothetical protein